jgi:catechol 2,3-dioxygenase-like lactoylglutathione lyase family enzyme
MITGIDHVHVMCRDLDESIEFYTKVLGFYFLRRTQFGPPEARGEVAFVGVNGILVELFPMPRGATEIPESAKRPFGLMVDDMEATVADLRARGVEVFDERIGWTFSGKYAAIRDPSGVMIELRQWFADDSTTNPNWQPANPQVVRVA